MKFDNYNTPNLPPQNSAKSSPDKYMGLVEPEISDIIKDAVFLLLIQSDGMGLDKFLSVMKLNKINL
ncbi:MAG: hypothetical protein AB7U85_09160 [Alphaproteobacteria bacterium]